jgi:hypothetical protein
LDYPGAGEIVEVQGKWTGLDDAIMHMDNCRLNTKFCKGSSVFADTYPTQQFLHTSGSHSLSAAKHGHWRLRH